MRTPPILEQVARPVLFVAGEKELKAVRQSNDVLAELMPNAQSYIILDMGHGWHAKAPDLHCWMIRSWISD
jgi:pimeloyl-ACP methyl ester carboxylesterase